MFSAQLLAITQVLDLPLLRLLALSDQRFDFLLVLEHITFQFLPFRSLVLSSCHIHDLRNLILGPL